ncbi:unnamed protein product [Discosporangium mesarthrocarpum]
MSEGKVTKYAVKIDAPFQVFEPESEEDKRARHLSYPERVARKLDISIVDTGGDENELVFDLVGVDVSVANALRRILLSEVPTLAIEHVYMFMNSSIIHDEVFAHRLGLVPIKADPRAFEFIGGAEGDDPTEFNTAVFKIDVKNPAHQAEPAELPRGTAYAAGPRQTLNVFSGALEWIPQGGQLERFPEGMAPVHEDILLAKLRPDQEIIAEMHCRKGNGKDHAKFSPVATASYRLLPRVTLKEDLLDGEADALVAKCPMGVFDIEDLASGQRQAKVSRPRDCTMCRECIREEGWGERVALERVADHFIFSIESELLKDAISVLRSKCEVLIQEVERYEGGAELNDAL